MVSDLIRADSLDSSDRPPTETGPVASERSLAGLLNRNDLRDSLDTDRLRQALEGQAGGSDEADRANNADSLDISWHDLRRTHPHLFAAAPVYIDDADRCAMARLINAIERVVILPGWQERALAEAPASARHVPKTACAFLGYDFHLGERGPQLIEINTNAGGGLLGAKLLRAQKTMAGEADGKPFSGRFDDAAAVEAAFVDMFREEWRLARGARPLTRIAIVDDAPETQFLRSEFHLFQKLFVAAGIEAVIVDPRELSLRAGHLWLGERQIDLVYNRLTDFSLDEPAHAVLREAWISDAAVVTPHPQAYALYADKRNLVALSDEDWLRDIGVRADDLAVLQTGIPPARRVWPEDADAFWQSRRNWFFKPATGFGGRAAYRGDKLTRRVFADIANAGYIAQTLVPPAERRIQVDGAVRSLKFDVRCFVYRGNVQLVSARLYQGQTTNFRTHGGGFAAVVTV